jgi:hypothetical protein
MEKLTRPEELMLEIILKREKERAEKFLEENGDAFEAYFVKNETLPLINRLIDKLEV